MPGEVFQFTTLTRVLGENVELAEALGIPEVSTLDDTERRCRAGLQAKARALLEDENLCPALSLHRRRIVAEVALDSIEVNFDPPRRSPDWLEPARVRVQFARWADDDLHHAFVPTMGIHVFATRPDLLPERVEQHVRLVLASQRKRVTLIQLAGLERVQDLRLGRLEVTAHRKTPKQIAGAAEASHEKTEALLKLAEQLSPVLTRSGGSELTSTVTAASKVPQAAFEMEAELRQLAEMLSGPHRRSILLVGPPGCGKTALVRELARRRSEFGFTRTPFWSTNGARLMTGPSGFGMWQERCQDMCREAAKTQAVIHLGNLGELLEVGKASRGEQSVGGFLRPWIARGELLAIAECAPDQLGMIERREPHLLGTFQQWTVPERTPQQTRAILNHAFNASLGKPPADANAVSTALDRLHQLHVRYATYSANPGRPVRFLKNVVADCFPEKNLTEAGVIAGFSRETGLPLVLLDDAVPLHLDETREWFARRVIGQPEAVDRVLDLLAIVKARLARPRKPLASFLFIGPTGTGKTEMAKALAEFLFSDSGRMVRFDLNEFSDSVSVQRLIGGPATGDAEGLLTARVREQPFSVVLLDEFEKADPSFFDLLLQILGDGRLTDAAGRVADFCNSVIVMTSNLGAQGFQRGPAGFRVDGSAPSHAQDHFSDAVRKFLRPEIFNRLDAVVPFRVLPPEVVLAIARRHLDLIHQRDGIRLRGVECRISEGVAEHLAQRGYDARYGARPLKRLIERELLVPLAEALNQYGKDTPLDANVGVDTGRIRVSVRTRERREREPDRVESSGGLAEAVIEQRRRVSRLLRCSATSKLEDEVTMIEALERRFARAKWKSPDMQARLAKLPGLRDCLQAISKLFERARHLETETLGALYQRETLDRALFAPELDALEAERRRLIQAVFRFQHGQPDDVVLAFYGQPRETLFEFAAAFRQLASEVGRVVAMDYFAPPPGGRSRATQLVRETPEHPDRFFASPPEKAIGVVMHLHGELVFPRFRAEAGLQLIKEKQREQVCLIEVAPLPFGTYEPPAGIERPGAIKSRGAPVCRVFDRTQSSVMDAILGERPWQGAGLARCLAVLIAERLDREIEQLTQ